MIKQVKESRIILISVFMEKQKINVEKISRRTSRLFKSFGIARTIVSKPFFAIHNLNNIRFIIV